MISPGPLRSRVAAAALAGLLVFCPLTLHAQQDSTLEELQFEIDLARAASGLMIAVTRDSTVYLPFIELLDLALVRIDTVEPGVRLRAMFGAPPLLLGIEGGLGLAVRGRETRPLDSAVIWRDGRPYVATDLAAWLLGVGMTVYWSDLRVVVEQADDLPLMRARRREAARRILQDRSAPGPEAPLIGTPEVFADGMVLDWALTTATRAPRDNYGVQLGMGMALMGGSLTVQHQATRAPFGTTTETRWQWLAGWPEGQPVRQARAGEIGAGGPRGFPVRGAAISNAPVVRPAVFDDIPLRGTLPAGWEVELYRGEELIGFTSAGEDGSWAIDIPAVYGANPTDIVAYGPRGESVRRSRTLAIPFERLSRGRFEYSMGGGECVSFQCEWAGNVDLRYGFSNIVTLQAGYDRFWRDSLPGLDHPYALLAVAPLNMIGIQAEAAANAFLRGRLDVDPSPDFHLDVGHIRFDSSVVRPVIGSSFVRHSTEAALFMRPGLGQYTYFQASVSHVAGLGATRQRAMVGGTTRLLGARFAMATRIERDEPDGGLAVERSGLDVGLDGVIRGGPGVIRSTFFRATVQTDCEGLRGGCDEMVRQVSFGLARSIGRSLRLDATARRDRGVRGLSFDVTVTVARPWLRATSRNSVVPNMGVVGTQLLEGSVLWNRRRGELGLSSGRQLGRAGLDGMVYLDHNANGVRDPGEPGVQDVLLRIGSYAVATDSAGRFSVWDLVPFADALVEVDTLGLPNPLWVPTNPVVRVPPGPNSFRTVLIPLQEGAELNGSVEIDGRPIGGARVILTQHGTNRTREVVTFTDGTFYLLGLPAGEWTITAAPGMLEQLRAREMPLTVTVGGVGSTRVDGLVVRLVRD